VVNWIMGCVTLANFSVLNNGYPSKNFKGSRGLRQGCLLSTFLFSLVVEGLSRLIHVARVDGSIKGVLVVQHARLTHLLFIDDFLLFWGGTIREWRVFNYST
jgi:hypothetical protein